MKLDIRHKHILRLIKRDAGTSGWASVSEKLFPVLLKSMPKELVTFKKQEVGGIAKLTSNGESVVYSMKWIS